jgi:endonuclease V-like protein UPF0215 family
VRPISLLAKAAFSGPQVLHHHSQKLGVMGRNQLRDGGLHPARARAGTMARRVGSAALKVASVLVYGCAFAKFNIRSARRVKRISGRPLSRVSREGTGIFMAC